MSTGFVFIALGMLTIVLQSFAFGKSKLGVIATALVISAIGILMTVVIVLGHVLNPPTLIVQ